MTDAAEHAARARRLADASWNPPDAKLARETLKSLADALDAEATRAAELEAQLRAATDIIIQAEKIAPGLSQLAGRFAIGDVAEARAERDALAARLETALEALLAAEGVLYALPKSAQSKRRFEVLAQVRQARRAALAAVGEPGEEASEP